MFDNHKDDLTRLQIAFDIARAVRRDLKTGKAYSISQFAEQFIEQNPSMVTKVFSGVAKSEPVLKAIARFILDTELHKTQFNEFNSLARNILER
jgi:hypothetical protein